ncbi:MAG: hypothetical protein LBJ93_00530 [Clostridiales bacterium]|nr:hypothetical protein [Clostridiales bacterium]
MILYNNCNNFTDIFIRFYKKIYLRKKIALIEYKLCGIAESSKNKEERTESHIQQLDKIKQVINKEFSCHPRFELWQQIISKYGKPENFFETEYYCKSYYIPPESLAIILGLFFFKSMEETKEIEKLWEKNCSRSKKYDFGRCELHIAKAIIAIALIDLKIIPQENEIILVENVPHYLRLRFEKEFINIRPKIEKKIDQFVFWFPFLFPMIPAAISSSIFLSDLVRIANIRSIVSGSIIFFSVYILFSLVSLISLKGCKFAAMSICDGCDDDGIKARKTLDATVKTVNRRFNLHLRVKKYPRFQLNEASCALTNYTDYTDAPRC